MSWKLLKNISKWVWVAAVLVFVVFYAISKKTIISQMLSMLSVELLFGAGLLVLVAKLCLVANMRQAANHFSIALGWDDSYRIYNLTQLGKYIPGSIWQFIGRISILRERGVPAKSIRDSLMAEHLWVITSATLLAGLLIAASSPSFFSSWLADMGFELDLPWLLAIGMLITLIGVSILMLSRRLLHWLRGLLPPPGAILILLLVWLALGASLWVTIVPFVAPAPSLIYVVGIYCFAYVAGFLVPFAPAGLGVREGILVLALIPYISADTAILLTAVNRIIYFLVELVVAIFCIREKSPIN